MWDRNAQTQSRVIFQNTIYIQNASLIFGLFQRKNPNIKNAHCNVRTRHAKKTKLTSFGQVKTFFVFSFDFYFCHISRLGAKNYFKGSSLDHGSVSLPARYHSQVHAASSFARRSCRGSKSCCRSRLTRSCWLKRCIGLNSSWHCSESSELSSQTKITENIEQHLTRDNDRV